MVKQYVGARYVPKFASPIEWAADTSYEALTIVTFNNASYTSKIQVPPTIGNPANNPKYWALTGNYNAQVEDYREHVSSFDERISENTNNLSELTKIVNTIAYTPEMFNGIGDGSTDDTVALNTMFEKANEDKIPVILGSKTYAVSNTINTKNATILPSTGIIKALESFPSDTPLVLSSDTAQGSSGAPDQDAHTFTVQFLRVNGNDVADTGIKVQYICGGILNYEIYNCTNKGIDISNCLDCTFDIDVKNQNALGNYGCYIDDNDNTFTKILVSNYNTGVYVTGINHFEDVHYWLGIVTNYENSVAIECHAGCSFEHIYADTCKKGLIANTNLQIGISVGNYLYVNNNNIIPMSTYEEMHLMFHAENGAMISVNSIAATSYASSPSIKITDTPNYVAISDHGYSVRNYSYNAGFENNTNAFIVTTNKSAAYENMPSKLKTEHPTNLYARVFPLKFLTSEGANGWLCIDPTYHRLFLSKSATPTSDDWYEFNCVRYEQVEVSCTTNSVIPIFTTYGSLTPSSLTGTERIISAQILDKAGSVSPAICSIHNTGSNAYKSIDVYGSAEKTYTVLIGISDSALF